MGYKKITFYSDTKVDYLIYLLDTATPTEISNANAWGYIPAWDDYTNAEIFAPFTSTLVSSYVAGLTSPLTGYVIYRKKLGETKLTKVAEVDTTVSSVIDYNVGNKGSYIYIVYPATVSELGISMTSDSLTTCWWDWSVTELNQLSEGIYSVGDVWLFDGNLQSGDVSQNLDQTIYKTYSQFPKSSVGGSNFKTLGFSCLLNKVSKTSSVYTDTISMKNDWDALVAKGNPVLLKDPKGNVYYGQLQNPTSRVTDVVGTQPITIDISFTELANPEDFQIYTEV